MSIPVSQVRVCQPLNHAKQDMNAYGGIREMSELDPLPGVVGFCSVVSTSVQPSPLNPQLPFAPSTVECVNKHGRVGGGAEVRARVIINEGKCSLPVCR